MKNWKRHEKKTAEILNGKRVLRGANFSQSAPDVEHPLLSIECKYRQKISDFLKDGLRQAQKYDAEKIPALVLKEKNMRGALILLRLSDFEDLFGSLKKKKKTLQKCSA